MGTRKIEISHDNYVRHEFIYEYIFVRGLQLTLMELRLLVFLNRFSSINFGEFCRYSVKVLHPSDSYGHKSQNIRNVINKMVTRGFLTKEGGLLRLSFVVPVEDGVIYSTLIKVK